MNRRELLKTAAASLPLISVAAAEEIARKSNGLPPLTIKDVKVITTNGGNHYRWVFLKIITSEPGLYGIGSANNYFQTMAVVAALEDHLKPWLMGKDPDRIEDLWQSAQMRTYWRNGPVNNNVLAAMDMALWDIKGKRAGMPVYEMLGGKARDARSRLRPSGWQDKRRVPGRPAKVTGQRISPMCASSLAATVRAALSRRAKAIARKAATRAPHLMKQQYVDTIPPLFDYLRAKAGFGPKLIHDVHSHLSGMNAVELARRFQPYQMFFVEDILPPEQIDYYRNIREICTTPQAVGEVFSHPFETIPLVKDRLIDFIRCRVAATGGITPIRKLTTLCELFGVRTAFQEGGENDPINQLASYHVDISSSAFGIQEENHFPPVVHEMFPGMAEIRKGYLYDSGKPGLGVDINEELAAKNPLGPFPDGGAYPTDRTIDGTVVKP